MKLEFLKLFNSPANNGAFDNFEVFFERDLYNSTFSPICLIGPNGSGKSQFLQIIAEIFQAAWHVAAPKEERKIANDDIIFELQYIIRPINEKEYVTVKLIRSKKGKSVEFLISKNSETIIIKKEEYYKFLPSIIVGYTSGDNETLSLPFLVSRSGYAEEVASSAISQANEPVYDNRLVMIDYSTNLEVLFANMILGNQNTREKILSHAGLSDLASCRCIIRLAHSVINKAPLRLTKITGRKGIQLTSELEDTISCLQKIATCWSVDEKTETYTFDFFINTEMRKAFAHYWENSFKLYRALHKLALLNDLAIPRSARKRLEKAVKEKRFATRLPEPQQEEMVFSFEEVRFWPKGKKHQPLDYVSLSDGEHQQALILGTYAMINENNALFLLDEPESHFNPQWRVKFVQRLMDLTDQRIYQDLLLTSHSPFVPSDMPKEQIVIFSKDPHQDKIIAKSPPIETFGATFDRILENCFEISPPISKIAENRINELLLSNNVEETETALNELGQSVEKAFLADHLRRLKKKI